MHISAQKTGDLLLWNQPVVSSSALSLTQEPCALLQKRLEQSQPLPPAAQALLQTCVQTKVYEFSAQKITTIIPRVADQSYAQSLPEISKYSLAIAQYPTLESRVQELCTQKRLSNSNCAQQSWERAKKALDALLVTELQSQDDRRVLRALQLACTLGPRGSAIAQSLSEKSSMHVILNSCTLTRTQALTFLESYLLEDHPLLPITVLELRRHKAVELKEKIRALSVKDRFTQTIKDFALKGIP